MMACASQPVTVASQSDFPLSESGAKNSNSKFSAEIFFETQIVNANVNDVTNASGITYSPKENLLYVITNNNNELHIYESANIIPSRAVQTIQLKGWSDSGIKNDQDLEDIVYLGQRSEGQPEFALINEGSPNSGAEVYICVISQAMSELYRSDCDRIHVKVAIVKNNKGPEGLAYDAINKIFYVVVEGNEKGKDLVVAEFKRPDARDFKKDPTGAKAFAEVTALPLFDSENLISELCPDLSSVVFSSKNQRLYLLTHIGDRAIDVDLKGKIYGQFPLPRNLQFEGIAFDNADNLLFISEPNIIYKFLRQP